jgi:adenylate cyclase
LPDIPSIAVLPFANMSGDPQQEYFSDGITDDLITALARLPGLFVIARTSTFTYKGKAAKVQEVGRELGVRYVLEGSVHKAGDQVRITAQLVDATTGVEAWAETYDRPMRDIFALQDEIVRRIVATANLQIKLLENRVQVGRRSDNIEAYDDYLRASEYFVSNPTKERNAKARQMCEKAIALDPQYADAYALLGFTYLIDMNNQWSRDPHVSDRIFQLAQQALALDPSNGGAYRVLSQLYLKKRQYDKSVAAAERSFVLDPSTSFSYDFLAFALTASGKPAEALKVVEKARRLNPRMAVLYLLVDGFAYNMMGRYEEAIPVLKSFISHAPDFLIAHYDLAVAYTELGREADARAEAAEILRINPQYTLADQKVEIKDVALAERWNADLRKAGLN